MKINVEKKREIEILLILEKRTWNVQGTLIFSSLFLIDSDWIFEREISFTYKRTKFKIPLDSELIFKLIVPYTFWVLYSILAESVDQKYLEYTIMYGLKIRYNIYMYIYIIN